MPATVVVHVGVSMDGTHGCILKTTETFKDIAKKLGEHPNARLQFVHAPEDWESYTWMDSLTAKERLIFTGESVPYEKTFNGVREDGKEWSFRVSKILEVDQDRVAIVALERSVEYQTERVRGIENDLIQEEAILNQLQTQLASLKRTDDRK